MAIELIVQDDCCFAICDKESMSNVGVKLDKVRYVCAIDSMTYDLVKNMLELHKDKIQQLMIADDKGNIPYWEKNWHDKLSNIMSHMFKKLTCEISNSLSALGY